MKRWARLTRLDKDSYKMKNGSLKARLDEDSKNKNIEWKIALWGARLLKVNIKNEKWLLGSKAGWRF